MNESKIVRPLRIAAIMLITAGVLVLLVVAKKILIPIVIACILAYATIALARTLQSYKYFKKTLPTWLAQLLSILVLGVLAWLVIHIIQSHIGLLIEKVPFYEAQLIRLSSQMGIDVGTQLSKMLANINIAGMLASFAGSLANIGSKAILVVIYTGFMIIEFPFIKNKIRYLFRGHDSEKEQTKHILSFIAHDVNTYFRIKAMASLMTAILCYVVLVIFNVDFALFWALLVLVLNFIPTIGSIIAVFFPALLTLVQFASFGKFFVVLILLVLTQLFIGNVVEPRIAGRVLNISPLIILFALVIAGALWGVVGMIISVPVIIVVKIIAEQFPGTKLISILLSRNGKDTV